MRLISAYDKVIIEKLKEAIEHLWNIRDEIGRAVVNPASDKVIREWFLAISQIEHVVKVLEEREPEDEDEEDEEEDEDEDKDEPEYLFHSISKYILGPPRLEEGTGP